MAKEGITNNVHVVGDVMQDALFTFLPSAKPPSTLSTEFFNNEYGLLTIHRPSNTDNAEALQNIVDGIKLCQIPFVWPLHPRNRKNIQSINIPDNLYIINPLSYFEMLYLLSHCTKVITDSGGLQKEAYWLKKPCITVRPQTEWVETLHNHWNQLCIANATHIELAFKKNPDQETWIELYGNGNSCYKIAKELNL